jgi:hypothetical protein
MYGLSIHKHSLSNFEMIPVFHVYRNDFTDLRVGKVGLVYVINSITLVYVIMFA